MKNSYSDCLIKTFYKAKYKYNLLESLEPTLHTTPFVELST